MDLLIYTLTTLVFNTLKASRNCDALYFLNIGLTPHIIFNKSNR